MENTQIMNTQKMNSTEVEYISIYDKPKRERQKPGSKYTELEKLERRRLCNLKTYYNNHEYYKLYGRLNKQIESQNNKTLI